MSGAPMPDILGRQAGRLGGLRKGDSGRLE